MNTPVCRWRRRAVVAFAALGAVAWLPGCTSPPPSSSLCAGDVSIARVDITIVSVPSTGTRTLTLSRLFSSTAPFGDSWVETLFTAPTPLVVGQTYTAAQQTTGLVDLGRCLDLQASPGVEYTVAAYPVTDPQVMALYALQGGRLSQGTNRGTLPAAPRTPVDVVGLSGATDLSAGGFHSCAVTAGGGVTCWGRNSDGQLGDGATTWSKVPVEVVDLGGVTQVDAGMDHTCAVQAAGSVECWGANDSGGLGDGTTTGRLVPGPVPGLTGVLKVSAGYGHTCALLVGGTLKCWGGNHLGQLGDGTTTDRTAPVDVVGVTGATDVAVYFGHSCAVVAGGGVKCWGGNDTGQLGDGTTSASPSPVDVVGLSGATQVAVGYGHSCAATLDGGVECWGWNHGGHLGDGTWTDSFTPVAAAGLAGTTQLTAGFSHACAVDDGTVQCWGSGPLGTGSPASAGVPTPVVGPVVAAKVSGGNFHTCALVAGGAVKCWGDDFYGQLGDGG